MDITNVADNENNNGSNKFKEIKLLLNDIKEIIDEQEMLGNNQWIHAVDNGFNGIRKIVKDVKMYRNRITNPRTWKDHNNTTMFLGPVNIFKYI